MVARLCTFLLNVHVMVSRPPMTAAVTSSRCERELRQLDVRPAGSRASAADEVANAMLAR